MTEAIRLLHLAAAGGAGEPGHRVAMCHLGVIYCEGVGTATDVGKAKGWWETAADLGRTWSLLSSFSRYNFKSGYW